MNPGDADDAKIQNIYEGYHQLGREPGNIANKAQDTGTQQSAVTGV